MNLWNQLNRSLNYSFFSLATCIKIAVFWMKINCKMNSLLVTSTKVVLISTGQQYTKQYWMSIQTRYRSCNVLPTVPNVSIRYENGTVHVPSCLLGVYGIGVSYPRTCVMKQIHMFHNVLRSVSEKVSYAMLIRLKPSRILYGQKF